MWKYASILILSILISSYVHAQKYQSVSQVDKETFELYQKQQWKQLIVIGEKSIEQGIDFYYLRLRMGIAYYNMKNYRKSAVFFQKLSQQNPEDKSIKEYLYFSYLLGDRSMDAIRMQNELPQTIREKYGIDKIKFISGIYAETKYEFLDDYTINSDQIQQQTVRKQFHHYSLGLNHQVGERIALFHAYSLVDLKNLTVSEGISFDEEVHQNQYYLKSSFQLGYGTKLVFSGHWVQTKVKGYPFTIETVTEAALLSLQLKGNGKGGNGAGGSDNGGSGDSGAVVEIYPYANTQNSFIGYMGLQQDISNWKVSVGLLYYDTNDLTRLQQEVSVRFYPLGNLKFYINGRFTNQMEEKLDGDWLNRRYWNGGLGFQLAKNTWAQLGYSSGDMFMQVENEGYSVYNSINLVKNRGEIGLYQYIFKGKLSIFLLYQNQRERNTYMINDELNRQHINVQSIIGGIKWNF